MRLLHAGHADGGESAARPQPQSRPAQNVVEAIRGNICRCTGYEPIIKAVLDAARGDSRRRA